jgi:D-alanyl-lipoteichoic acid acyltransferase DltB (MBOAT superfamily)
MDGSIDFYKPDFWCVLALAVVVLVPIQSATARKWAWAAINLVFLGLLLGVPDLARVGRALQQLAIGDAVTLLAGSGLGMACGLALIAWIVAHAIQHRWLGVLPLLLSGLAIFFLFLIHKLPAETIYASDQIKEAFEKVGLSSGRLDPLRALLTAIGFSYVALRLVEVFRFANEGRAAPDFPSTINYLMPFHMLAAGPIQRYADFVAQPAVSPALGSADALRGVERIAQGLFKKYVLAAVIEKAFFTHFRAPFPYLGVEGLLYYLWLYLDFSGYSDLAVGAGRLMGVATPENFNRPYIARNLIDFWERWHMSLSRFIYRNLFIPVQMALLRRAGPQAAIWCASLAFTLAFLLCGLWHELSVRWLLWGAMHAAGLVTVNWYRVWLQRRLGREGFNRYNAHRGVRLASTILTQVYVASTLVIATWPQE